MNGEGANFGGNNTSGEEVIHEMVGRMAQEEWLNILDGGHESYQQQSHRNSNLDDTNYDNDQDGCNGSESHGEQQHYEHSLWKGVFAAYRSVSTLQIHRMVPIM